VHRFARPSSAQDVDEFYDLPMSGCRRWLHDAVTGEVGRVHAAPDAALGAAVAQDVECRHFLGQANRMREGSEHDG
jgi:hypothetical protein